ncbi:MAG: efflux RND transporter periplasmic adaptor subunit [Myxococcales bacterium]|nr:efflux RND transporter periplasmic adaptor subunit [Myxococcales bacterium]
MMRTSSRPPGIGRALALALALALLPLACQSAAGDPTGAAPAEAAADEPHEPAAVRWIETEAARPLAVAEAPARVLIAPGSAAAIAPPFPARIDTIKVAPGQTVSAGSVVAEVTIPAVIAAAGDLRAATTRKAAYQQRHDQLEALRREGLARLAEIAEVEVQIAEAEASAAVAQATLRSAGLSPKDAQRLLRNGGRLPLRTPIAGVVTEILTGVGESHDPSAGPLLRVVGEGPLRIEGRFTRPPPVDARYLLDLAGGGPSIPVTPIAEAPAIDGRDAALPIWFSVAAPPPAEGEGAGEDTAGAKTPAPIPQLRAGAHGRIRVLLGDLDGVVSVPAEALVIHDGVAQVVAREGGARPVRVLVSDGHQALITAEGGPKLAPGVALAADAAQLLHPGEGD